jgi:hypothetical protein
VRFREPFRKCPGDDAIRVRNHGGTVHIGTGDDGTGFRISHADTVYQSCARDQH